MRDNLLLNMPLVLCILRFSSLTGGSGQQCCYRNNGLVVGSPGGGTADLVSPDVNFFGHFVQDVVPFLLCCKAGIFSNCDEYYRHRPSDTGFPPPQPPPPPGRHKSMFYLPTSILFVAFCCKYSLTV